MCGPTTSQFAALVTNATRIGSTVILKLGFSEGVRRVMRVEEKVEEAVIAGGGSVRRRSGAESVCRQK